MINGPALSARQAHVLARLHNRVNLLDGSIRSGKTFTALLWYAIRMADPIPGGEHMIAGRNMGSIYRNVFAPFNNEPALAWAAPYIHYRQDAPTAIMFGQRVNIIPANDKAAADKIQGSTFATGLIEEASVLPENFVRQALGRFSPAGARLVLTTNPSSPNHWLKRDFIDRLDQLPHWSYFHMVMDDNDALADDYKNAIKSDYTGLWYNRYILGEWTAAEGAVYDMWNPDLHIVAYDQLPTMADLYAIGIDYGTTNATSAILLGRGVNNILYFIDEWRLDQANRQQAWTDAQLSHGLRQWATDNRYTPRHYIVDPAAASFKAQLWNDGVRNLMNADNDVVNGIRLVANLLKQGKLKVSDRCAGLIDEFPGYVWDPKATDDGKDKPVKANDHSLDAARYAIASTRGYWQPLMKDETTWDSQM